MTRRGSDGFEGAEGVMRGPGGRRLPRRAPFLGRPGQVLSREAGRAGEQPSCHPVTLAQEQLTFAQGQASLGGFSLLLSPEIPPTYPLRPGILLS